MNQTFRGGNVSIVNRFIVLLILLFIAQSLEKLFFGQSFLLSTLSLSFDSVKAGMVWTFFTYVLLHDGPFHLIFNLIGLHFIARFVEDELGAVNFLWLCAISGLLGGMAWLFFNESGANLIGVSAIVTCCLSYFCLARPDSPISFLLFFVLPIRLKPKVILLAVLGLELYGFVFSELANGGSIAHSSHLGGMMAGAIFLRLRMNGLNLPVIKFRFRPNKKNTFNKKDSLHKPSNKNYRVDISNYNDLQKEVDRILDKINEKGFGSLSSNEKETLDKAKTLLHNN